MLKLASIAVLLATAALSAWLSRPSPQQFREVMLARIERRGESAFFKNYQKVRLENDLKTCTFRNRVLWVDVERQGKVIYSGLLGHWIERNITKRF